MIIPKQYVIKYKDKKMSITQQAEDNEWIKFIDTLDCCVKCIKVENVERDLNTPEDLSYLLNKYN